MARIGKAKERKFSLGFLVLHAEFFSFAGRRCHRARPRLALIGTNYPVYVSRDRERTRDPRGSNASLRQPLSL